MSAEIIDAGNTASFRMTSARDPSQTASVTAKVSGAWDHNHMIFLNREYHGGDGYLAYLHNVTISATPRASAGAPDVTMKNRSAAGEPTSPAGCFALVGLVVT